MTAAVALTPEAMSQQRKNPFLVPYGTQFNIPPFEKITYDDYLPAIKEGIARREQEVEKITGQASRADICQYGACAREVGRAAQPCDDGILES